MNVDFLQHVKRSLSGFNQGVKIGIVDSTVSGANTFAVFRARVAALTGLDIEESQTLQQIVLPALDDGNILSILTDTNLNGLTTVASVQALFTAQDGNVGATYGAMNVE
jgi:hypothetical protein